MTRSEGCNDCSDGLIAEAREVVVRSLAREPFLPRLTAAEVLRAPARRGGDREHGPWVELALHGAAETGGGGSAAATWSGGSAAARVALVSCRLIAFARAGLVPPSGDDSRGRSRPRLSPAALLLRARAALSSSSGEWRATGLFPRGERRARAVLHAASGERAEVHLDAHTGTVLGVSLRAALRPAPGPFGIDREAARTRLEPIRAQLRASAVIVPEVPVVLRDPRTGSARPIWRCAARVEVGAPSFFPGGGTAGGRLWLYVDAQDGRVEVERAA